MSFILDALKKLEEKRNNVSAPDLMTIHTEGSIEQGKSPLLIYILVAVLLLNAVVLAVWLRPQEKKRNALTAQTPKEIIVPPAPAIPIIEKATINIDPQPAQPIIEADATPDNDVEENIEVPAIEAASLTLTPSPEEVSALKSKIAEEQLSVNTSPVFEPVLEEESDPVAERKVLDMSQLPLSMRKGLPDMTINGHIYSNSPMSRIVNINGNILREGETVTTGLKVNEITMSGVIFDYGGQLFSMRAF